MIPFWHDYKSVVKVTRPEQLDLMEDGAGVAIGWDDTRDRGWAKDVKTIFDDSGGACAVAMLEQGYELYFYKLN